MTKTFDELLESVNVGDTVTGLLKADLKTILHQELQKAREETIRDMERKMMGWSGTATAMLKDYRKIIYRDQSELDQPNK